jgi:hypothetical protein
MLFFTPEAVVAFDTSGKVLWVFGGARTKTSRKSKRARASRVSFSESRGVDSTRGRERGRLTSAERVGSWRPFQKTHGHFFFALLSLSLSPLFRKNSGERMGPLRWAEAVFP